MRIATFGGTMQETQQKAYFEPFEKTHRHQGASDFAGSDPTKIKAMVETGNVEWDIAQLSRGSILNLMKRGDYFEKIDYSWSMTASARTTASNTGWRCWSGRR